MKLSVDLSGDAGRMKVMHAVNNGPVLGNVRGVGNDDCFREAKIPYARNHDAAFYTGYGGEFTVDVHRIFADFDADENDPASYLFEPTDNYISAMVVSGVEPFYRLGAAIEHYHKKGTYPPPDTLKWARICEHIIRHYTEGWANGFTYKITYWEIWNEFDCRNSDGSNPCWQGTEEEFFVFFGTVATYLKGKFPHLKIGGPAISHLGRDEVNARLFTYLRDHKIPLDFFSFHWYGHDPERIAQAAAKGRALADAYGYTECETILNEWNYVCGWLGEGWQRTLKIEKNRHGAAFIAAAMAEGQYSPLDMLMYYDARPCGMNGMFDIDSLRPIAGYYPFLFFSKLYDKGRALPIEGNGKNGIYAVAAADGTTSALMFSYFSENEKAGRKEVEISFAGLAKGARATVTVVGRRGVPEARKPVAIPSSGILSLRVSPDDIVLVETVS